jgi:hypothetical protein
MDMHIKIKRCFIEPTVALELQRTRRECECRENMKKFAQVREENGIYIVT